jgi:hypothetical protein
MNAAPYHSLGPVAQSDRQATEHHVEEQEKAADFSEFENKNRDRRGGYPQENGANQAADMVAVAIWLLAPVFPQVTTDQVPSD